MVAWEEGREGGRKGRREGGREEGMERKSVKKRAEAGKQRDHDDSTCIQDERSEFNT